MGTQLGLRMCFDLDIQLAEGGGLGNGGPGVVGDAGAMARWFYNAWKWGECVSTSGSRHQELPNWGEEGKGRGWIREGCGQCALLADWVWLATQMPWWRPELGILEDFIVEKVRN
eukprot:scaffold19459_cov58-Attheya_sp.AAC.4